MTKDSRITPDSSSCDYTFGHMLKESKEAPINFNSIRSAAQNQEREPEGLTIMFKDGEDLIAMMHDRTRKRLLSKNSDEDFLTFVRDPTRNKILASVTHPSGNERYAALREWTGLSTYLYAYDSASVRQLTDEDAVLPGMNSVEVTGAHQFKEWSMVETQTYGDDVKVLVGTIGDASYILHPDHRVAITPSFKKITEWEEDSLTIQMRGNKGELAFIRLSAVDDFSGTQALPVAQHEGYPSFLYADKLYAERVYPQYEVATRAKYKKELGAAALSSTDIFGLEQGTNETQNIAYGKAAFATVFTEIMKYAAVDDAVRRVLKQPQQELILPRVAPPVLTAMLAYTTREDNSALIRLVGGDNDEFGFYLAQSPDGTVEHIDLATQQRYTPSTQGYAEQIARAERTVLLYFKQLYQKRSHGALTTERLGELRQMMARGGRQSRRARREIATAINKRDWR